MNSEEFKEKLNNFLKKMEDFEISDSEERSLYGLYRGNTLYLQSYIKGIKNKVIENADKYEAVCDKIIKKIEKSDIKLKNLNVKKIKKLSSKSFYDENSYMTKEETLIHYKTMLNYYDEKIKKLEEEIQSKEITKPEEEIQSKEIIKPEEEILNKEVTKPEKEIKNKEINKEEVKNV